jgi:2-aminoadipate transaminase
MPFTLSGRAAKMSPSAIREILKVTERPGVINFGGGMPSPETFAIEPMRQACDRVLSREGRSALQYASSEGWPALRQWVAEDLKGQGLTVSADQVLITNGSQQALDLIGKVLLDPGSRLLVETPTYLGALQAFSAMEPQVEGVVCDEEGIDPDDMSRLAPGARLAYLLPNFQNPTGRSMSEIRRAKVAAQAQALGLPLVEDNPYGQLWFDQPPPAALSAHWPEGSIYMGTFSKILAPGLRLGFLAAPRSIYPKLLQAKQGADLHTASFNQRVVAQLLQDGFLERQLPVIRAFYRGQCQVMLAALEVEMAGLGVRWQQPAGGMFLWLRLPTGVSAAQLLPHALEQGVAFVPGSAFYAHQPVAETLRLSFANSSHEQIRLGVAALARTIGRHLPSTARPAQACSV